MYRDIKGYEGKYQIDESGNVKSLIRLKGKLLKHDINSGGYHRVTLCKDGKTRRFLLHRLVFETFIGEIPRNLQIHHIDENKDNNHISNLMLATAQENNHYSGVAKGYKLTFQDVEFIRENQLSTREIANKFGISLRHALKILKNERWTC